jgi:two-component system response regulator RegA
MDTSGTSRRSLLLVEDDPSNWLTLSALLEDAGFSVSIAESCAQATQLLEGPSRYEVVLLDSGLGDGDGRALVPLVRRRMPAAKLVLVTGMDGPEPRAPVDAVFRKGENTEELLACLERLLRQEPAGG